MPGLSRVPRRVAAAVALLALPATAFVAGRISLAGVEQASRGPAVQVSAIEWTVKEERIGRTLRLPGTLRLVDTPGPMLGVGGMLTALPAAGGATVEAGDVIATVDLRPVVAGQGSVPAFRALRAGDSGPDVRQLRAFLCERKALLSCLPSEKFTPSVKAAVIRWQKALGVAQTGVVQPSDVMWLPLLPAVVRPAATAAVGNRVTADDRPILTASGAPQLEVRLTAAQAELVPNGAPLSFDGVAGRVVGAQAAKGSAVEGEYSEQAMVLDVRGADGRAALCPPSGACGAVLGDALSKTVEVAVDVVAPMTGTGVPVRAVLTGADGATYVRLPDGTRVPVEVEATAGGLSIVSGLSVGDTILVSEQPRG